MPRAAPNQTNFTAGELSPRLEGRVDIAKYFNGLKKLENMIVLAHGGATRRGGTIHVDTAKAGKVRLIPFQFSITQAYVLEFGDQYIRFYRNQAALGGGAFSADFSNDFENVETVTEVVSPYLESELFQLQFAQSADVLYIVHPNHEPRTLSRISDISWTLAEVTTINGPYLDQNLTTVTITPSAITGAGITLTASAATFVSTDVGRLVRIDEGLDFGYAKIVGFTSTTVVTADVVDDFVSVTGQDTWQLGAWSNTTGFPGTIAFFEDRLVYAGSIFQPQTVWGSKSGFYDNFAPGTNADDPYNYTIATDQVNAIQWMSPGKSLTIGTLGGEFLMAASTRNEAITPTNVKIVRQSEYGGANIMPVRAAGVVLFVQRSTKKLRQFIYQFESDSYLAPDLTLLSEHITANGVVEMDYQRDPDSIIWLVRKDGQLIGMTYERDQQVFAWHRHIIGGVSDAAGTDAQVESVAVIPGSDNRDEVWLSVKRFVNGSTVRQLEVITKGRDTITPIDDDDFFVDAGLTFDGSPATVFSGLDHLEGETVQILADGAPVPDKTVSAGSITLDKAASVVHVGFNKSAIIKTLRLESGSANGTSQGKIKRINKVNVRLFDTLGAKVGPTEDKTDIIPFRSTSDPMDSSPPRFTGDKELPFPDGYNKEGEIVIRQDQPLPMTVLSIMPLVRTNG
jgi:hypothetical protein